MPTELLEAPRVLFSVFGVPITETVFNSWLVMAVILGLAFLVTRRLEEVPSKVQAAVEIIVEGIQGLVKSSMQGNRSVFTQYFGAMALYLYLANIWSLLGMRSPTADINVTSSMALLTFIMTHYMGLRTKGFGYIKGFLEPFFLFAPLNVIGELARPLSLALRLFGNMLGGSIIVGLVYNAIPLVVPVPLHLYFDLFAGLIQTFIFVMLSMTFISLAMD